MNEVLTKIKDVALFLLYPPKCAACDKTGYDLLCPECRADADRLFAPQKFICRGGNGYADEILALFPYRERTIQKLLFSLKREQYDNVYAVFLQYFDRARGKIKFLGECDRIAFCPRSAWNRRKYGFDQSAEMAKRLAQVFSLPFENCVKRKPFSFSQHRLKSAQRERNVKEKFRCGKRFDGETILLFDDIVTTGATACEVARVLKECGAMKVFVLTIAH